MNYNTPTHIATSQPTAPRKRVLILGGGFGGLYAARRLDHTLGKRQEIDVVLIGRENYLLFTPMLHEVAAGDLTPTDIVNPLRKMVRRVRVVQGEVTNIDLRTQTVRYVVGALRQSHELTYDYLLLALGSETHYFGMKDVEAAATTMKSLADAALLHNRLVAALEEAAQETDEARRQRLMTFVVAGGGFAGVETVGAINDFLRDALRYYPELTESMLRVVLVHAGTVVLPELSNRLGRYTQEKLQQRGVELRLETRVTGCNADTVHIASGDPIGAMSLIWTAGAAPAAVLDSLKVDKVNGRLKVNQFLEVAGHEGVMWAVGDCAAVPNGTGFHPPTAQHGMREAIVAANNIENVISGAAQKPFRFSTIGQLASIGHRTGVAQILGMRFSGFIAWWLWRTVYLAKLPGFSKKLRVLIKWSLELMFPREIEQLITLRDVERMEKIGAQLRAMRNIAQPVICADPLIAQSPCEHMTSGRGPTLDQSKPLANRHIRQQRPHGDRHDTHAAVRTETTRVRTVAYWATSSVVALAFAGMGVANLAHADAIMTGLTRLGYPPYLATILGAWKVLAAIAVLVPDLSRTKEWAYAGMFFTLTGAALSHAFSHDSGGSILAPLVLLGAVMASYGLRGTLRRSLDFPVHIPVLGIERPRG